MRRTQRHAMRTVAKTEAIERRVTELETLLRSSLARHPRISFDSLRITTGGPPLDLGALAKSDTGTTGGRFAPRPPSGLGRELDGGPILICVAE